MRKFNHLSLEERNILYKLIWDPNFKKKNGTINLSKIARAMNRSKNTISYELKHYQYIKRYHPVQSYKRYLANRRKCKKHIILTFNQLSWLNEKFNKLHFTPEQICKLYELEYKDKFPMCFKTLYKYIYLGLFNLNKECLYFHAKKRKTRHSVDYRGKLSNFRTIKEAKHDKNTFGWFQMDCIVGADHKSACLVLTEELTKFTICQKLKEQTANEVNKTLKELFKNRLLKKCIKGIITDQGSEFNQWREIEKITNTNLYFCDPGAPTQKPHVERMNRDIRHWLPKGTDFKTVSQERIDWIMQTINGKIRQTLNWQTSKQLFMQNLK